MSKDWELIRQLKAKLEEIKKDKGYHDQHREELKELLARCAEEARKESPKQ